MLCVYIYMFAVAVTCRVPMAQLAVCYVWCVVCGAQCECCVVFGVVWFCVVCVMCGVAGVVLSGVLCSVWCGVVCGVCYVWCGVVWCGVVCGVWCSVRSAV